MHHAEPTWSDNMTRPSRTPLTYTGVLGPAGPLTRAPLLPALSSSSPSRLPGTYRAALISPLWFKFRSMPKHTELPTRRRPGSTAGSSIRCLCARRQRCR